jgi:hypothetical protein
LSPLFLQALRCCLPVRPSARPSVGGGMLIARSRGLQIVGSALRNNTESVLDGEAARALQQTLATAVGCPGPGPAIGAQSSGPLISALAQASTWAAIANSGKLEDREHHMGLKVRRYCRRSRSGVDACCGCARPLQDKDADLDTLEINVMPTCPPLFAALARSHARSLRRSHRPTCRWTR